MIDLNCHRTRKKLGLNLNQMAVLKVFVEASHLYYKPTTLYIADYLGLTKTGVNKCIHHLQSRGYIVYDDESGDLVLTPTFIFNFPQA